ncbi:MAG: DUF1992 domain-containing protein [Pirellulaceae bacterium]
MTISQKAWKLIAEAKIEQAIKEGEFENLSGLGKPLNLDLTHDNEFWWLREKAKRENLSVLPPALILKREVQMRFDRIMELDSAEQVRTAVMELNQWIIGANLKVLWGPPSEVQPLQIDAVVQRWCEHRHCRPD